MLSWKSKGLSDENAPKISYVGKKTRVKFKGSCLSFLLKEVV